ncbi:hypothetical protein INR49_011983, partial [Caranx melampygus]
MWPEIGVVCPDGRVNGIFCPSLDKQRLWTDQGSRTDCVWSGPEVTGAVVQTAWQQQRGAGPLSSVSAEQPPQPTTPPTLSAVIERMPQHSDTPPKKAARVLRALREAEKSRVEPSRTWASHTPPSPRGPLSPCVRPCAAVRRPAAAAAAATCVDEPPVSHQYHTPPPPHCLPPSLPLSLGRFSCRCCCFALRGHTATAPRRKRRKPRTEGGRVRSGAAKRPESKKTLNQRRGVRARRHRADKNHERRSSRRRRRVIPRRSSSSVSAFQEKKKKRNERRPSTGDLVGKSRSAKRRTTRCWKPPPPSPPGPGPILRCVAAKAARRHHEGPYGGTAKCKMKFSSFFSIHVGLHVPSPPPPPPPPPPAPVAAAASRPRRLFSAASGGERSGEERRGAGRGCKRPPMCRCSASAEEAEAAALRRLRCGASPCCRILQPAARLLPDERSSSSAQAERSDAALSEAFRVCSAAPSAPVARGEGGGVLWSVLQLVLDQKRCIIVLAAARRLIVSLLLMSVSEPISPSEFRSQWERNPPASVTAEIWALVQLQLHHIWILNTERKLSDITALTNQSGEQNRLCILLSAPGGSSISEDTFHSFNNVKHVFTLSCFRPLNVPETSSHVPMVQNQCPQSAGPTLCPQK